MRLLPAALAYAALAASTPIETCPGYTASNVKQTSNSLTADLSLAGEACNVFGEGIHDLKLLVEYQTGEFMIPILGRIRSRQPRL